MRIERCDLITVVNDKVLRIVRNGKESDVMKAVNLILDTVKRVVERNVAMYDVEDDDPVSIAYSVIGEFREELDEELDALFDKIVQMGYIMNYDVMENDEDEPTKVIAYVTLNKPNDASLTYAIHMEFKARDADGIVDVVPDTLITALLKCPASNAEEALVDAMYTI